MPDGVENSAEVQVSEETQRLAELGRSGTLPPVDPLAPPLSETPRPAHIPEKFWDKVKGEVRLEEMAKSYAELESKIGQKPAEEKPEGEAEEKPEGETEAKPEGETEEQPEGEAEEKPEGEGDEPAPLVPTDVLTAAQAAFAEKGELDADARAPLHAVGVTDEQIDFYIAGVKALEASIWTAAEEAAGSIADLEAARQWAAANWSEKKIAAYDSQTGDVETVGDAVRTLMADYRKANPGEGRLTNLNGAPVKGDVYTDIKDFHKDLADADAVRDQAARKAAIDKMRRSRQAKSLKNTPRRQPFGN